MVFSRLVAGAVLTASVASFTPAAGAAGTFRPLSVFSEFSGAEDSETSCANGWCTVVVKSVLCQAAGVSHANVPYAGGCQATLKFVVRVVTTGGVSVCRGVTTGAVTMEYFDQTQVTVPADVVVEGSMVKFVSDPLFDVNGYAYGGVATGSAGPVCQGGDVRPPRAFSGRFSYVRLPH